MPGGLGPYEVWNFGAGKHYVFSAAQKSSRYLTALAELKPATRTGPDTSRTAADPLVAFSSMVMGGGPFRLDVVPAIPGAPASAAGGLRMSGFHDGTRLQLLPSEFGQLWLPDSCGIAVAL